MALRTPAGRSVRTPADDLELLLPAIERNLGPDQRTQAVARAIERADVAYDRDRLKALLK